MIILDPSTTNCPRCQAGGLAVEADSYGPFIHCLTCGFMTDPCHRQSGTRATGPVKTPTSQNAGRDGLWRHR